MKKFIHSRWFILAATMALIVALFCGFALPAMAEDTPSPTATASSPAMEIVKGKVSAIDTAGKYFEVQPKDGNVIQVNVDDNTKYFLVNVPAAGPFPAVPPAMQVPKGPMPWGKNFPMERPGFGNTGNVPNFPNVNANADDPEESPEMEQGLMQNCRAPQGFFNKLKSLVRAAPKFGQSAKFTDIKVGDGVVVRMTKDGSLAKQVMICKVPNITTIRGEITAISADAFTVMSAADANQSITFKWNDNTMVSIKGNISLAVGQYATVIYSVDGSDNIAKFVTSGPKPPAPPTPSASNTN